jgi:hypothetical protein
LQDGEGDDAAGAEVGVEPRKFGDAADVGGFVEDGNHWWVQASGWGEFSGADGFEEDAVGERGDQGCGGAGAVLGQQEQRLP